MTILFVAPLAEELAYFSRHLHDHGYTSNAGQCGRIVTHHFKALDLAVGVGGHGKTQFGLQTQHLLDHAPNTEAVVCFGAAGALADDLAVGDVVVATETVEHDYTLRFVSRPLPRFVGDAVLLSTLRGLSHHAFPFAVHFGIVASGDEDVIEGERAAALRQATEARAVGWEGAGGARACRFSRVPFVELRGITDTANHTAPADFETNLDRAMANIAALVARWRTTER